jgi:myo-inositol 2-dehydrogenase/D-chiro-inositol 1-dehydrogenase
MRIGLAGAGRIGEVHLRTLTRNPAVSQVRLYDPDTSRAEALCQAYGGVVVADVDGLLAGAEGLVIASPTPTHGALLDRALGRKLPTFCEKPVAEELAQVEDVAERAARIGCPVQVGFHYRFDPALRELTARSSNTGPRLLRVHSTTEFAPSSAYLASAGGLIADKLVHELDMVRWMTGSEVVRVAALPSAVCADGSEEVTTAALTLELADGALASVWGGYRSVAGFDLSVEVETAAGVWVAGNRRQVSDDPVSVHPSHVADFRDRFAAAYGAELDAFLNLVAGDGPNPCDLFEALRTQRLVVAAQTALSERRLVSLTDLSAATAVRHVNESEAP